MVAYPYHVAMRLTNRVLHPFLDGKDSHAVGIALNSQKYAWNSMDYTNGNIDIFIAT